MTATNTSFRAFVRDLRAFVEANDRMPSGRAGGPPIERILAASCDYWRGVLKTAEAEELSESTRKSLEAIPGWERKRRGGPQAVPTDVRIKELAAFVETNKHMPRPGSQSPEERSLAGWMSRVRDVHRRGELGAAFTTALETIPGWSWGRGVEGWEESFHDLQVYVDATGALPESRGDTLQEKRLAYWLDIQTRRYRGTRSPELTGQQRRMLESLPEWQP